MEKEYLEVIVKRDGIEKMQDLTEKMFEIKKEKYLNRAPCVGKIGTNGLYAEYIGMKIILCSKKEWDHIKDRKEADPKVDGIVYRKELPQVKDSYPWGEDDPRKYGPWYSGDGGVHIVMGEELAKEFEKLFNSEDDYYNKTEISEGVYRYDMYRLTDKLEKFAEEHEKTITLDSASKIGDIIKQTSKGYEIYSHDGKRLSKAYKTKKEAEERLKQIEMFKHMNDSYKGYTIENHNGLYQIWKYTADGDEFIAGDFSSIDEAEEWIEAQAEPKAQPVAKEKPKLHEYDVYYIDNQTDRTCVEHHVFAKSEDDAKRQVKQMYGKAIYRYPTDAILVDSKKGLKDMDNYDNDKVAELAEKFGCGYRIYNGGYAGLVNIDNYDINKALEEVRAAFPGKDEWIYIEKTMWGPTKNICIETGHYYNDGSYTREVNENWKPWRDSKKGVKDMDKEQEVRNWLEKYLVKKSDPKNKLGKAYIRALRNDERLPNGVYHKAGSDNSGILHYKGADYYWYIDNNDKLIIEHYIKDSTNRFAGESYFDKDMKGLEDRIDSNDLSKIKEWIWAKGQEGHATRVIDKYTGEIWFFPELKEIEQLEIIVPYEEPVEEEFEEPELDKDTIQVWYVEWFNKDGFKFIGEFDDEESADKYIKEHQDDNHIEMKKREGIKSLKDSTKDHLGENIIVHKPILEQKLRKIMTDYLLRIGYEKSEIDEYLVIRMEQVKTEDGETSVKIEMANEFVGWYELPEKVQDQLNAAVAPSYFEPYSETIWWAFLWNKRLKDSKKTKDEISKNEIEAAANKIRTYKELCEFVDKNPELYLESDGKGSLAIGREHDGIEELIADVSKFYRAFQKEFNKADLKIVKDDKLSAVRKQIDGLAEQDYLTSEIYEAVHKAYPDLTKEEMIECLKNSKFPGLRSIDLDGLKKVGFKDGLLPYHVLAWKLNEIMMAMNNEEAYYGSWIYLWPDGESREQCQVDFNTPESYKELQELFERVYKAYHKDGLFTKNQAIVDYAHKIDKKLGLPEIVNWADTDNKNMAKDPYEEDEEK